MNECTHGQLARSCETCERDARIAELEARVADLQRLYDWAHPVESHEWICKRCGLRQENPEKQDPAF